jgi:hypothetical protein
MAAGLADRVFDVSDIVALIEQAEASQAWANVTLPKLNASLPGSTRATTDSWNSAAQSEHVVYVRPAPTRPLSAAGAHRIDERLTRTRLHESSGQKTACGLPRHGHGTLLVRSRTALRAPHFDATPTPLSLSLKLSLRRGQSSSSSARLVNPEIAFAPMNTRIFRNYRCFRFRLERPENRSVDSSILSLATKYT